MISKITSRIIMSVALFVALLAPAIPAYAQTDVLGPACTGKGGDSAVCSTTGGDPVSSPNGIIHKATELIALMAGVAAVLTMVWAGIQYITSEGEPEAVSKAKRTIIYAAIGLIVIVLGRALINFALGGI